MRLVQWCLIWNMYSATSRTGVLLLIEYLCCKVGGPAFKRHVDQSGDTLEDGTTAARACDVPTNVNAATTLHP